MGRLIGLKTGLSERAVPAAAVLVAAISVTLAVPAASELEEINSGDGSVYTGEVKEGKRHGQGRQIWADGRVYDGQFLNDRMHDSKGLMKWPKADGRIYRGSFVKGVRDGKGSMTWPNGDMYTGDFKANRISGQGTFRWAETNDRYQGSFVDGVRHGFGMLTYGDGRQYEGEFVNSLWEGWGVLTQENSTYRGEFRGGRRHGVGIWTLNEEKWFQIWNENIRTESAPLTVTPHCRLQVDGQPWMFRGSNCINGFAHGNGLAASLDARFFVRDGSFVLGRLVEGEVQRFNSAGSP